MKPERRCTGRCALFAMCACYMESVDGTPVIERVQEDAARATVECKDAQKLADDIKQQAKSLETSYDTLMRDHIQLKEEAGQASGDKKTS